MHNEMTEKYKKILQKTLENEIPWKDMKILKKTLNNEIIETYSKKDRKKV